MSAPAPARDEGRRLLATVTVDGAVLDTDRIVAIETEAAVGRIPRARITVYDGDPATGRFPLSEGAGFAPGKRVTIAAGHGADEATIHAGVIVRQSLRIAPDSSSVVEIETADPLLKMALARRSAVHLDTTDAALIAHLVARGGGRSRKNGAATAAREAVVQAGISDWDLLLLRAEACGCVVIVEDGTVEVVVPARGEAALLLAYGDSIISLDATLDAAGQFAASAVKSRSWNSAGQTVSEGGAESVAVDVPGNLSSDDLAKVFAIDALEQGSAAGLAGPELALWSTARATRQALSQLRGTVAFMGSAKVKPGGHVELAGVGSRFDGLAFVGAVRHAISDGCWRTEVDLGLEPEGFAARGRGILDAPAAGLAAPIRGLMAGVVDKIAPDEAGEHRVRVRLPLLDASGAVWARVAQFTASSGFGAGFFPEVDDEVVLGFMGEDPGSAIVLGGLYSSGRAPAHPPDGKNDVKALVTRSKLELSFDDGHRTVEVRTPGGRSVKLDDDAGAITLADAAGNTIAMDRDGLRIASAGKLTLSSKAGLTLDCGAALSISAKVSCGVSAPEVSVEAEQELSLSSKLTGTLDGGAVLTVKGGLVKIN